MVGVWEREPPIRAEDRLFLLYSQIHNTQIHKYKYTKNINSQIQIYKQPNTNTRTNIRNKNTLSELRFFSSCFAHNTQIHKCTKTQIYKHKYTNTHKNITNTNHLQIRVEDRLFLLCPNRSLCQYRPLFLTTTEVFTK